MEQSFDFNGVLVPPLTRLLSSNSTATAAYSLPAIATSVPANSYKLPRDNPETNRVENTQFPGMVILPVADGASNENYTFYIIGWVRVRDNSNNFTYIPMLVGQVDVTCCTATMVIDGITYRLCDTITVIQNVPTGLSSLNNFSILAYSPGSDAPGILMIQDCSHIFERFSFIFDLDGHASANAVDGMNLFVGGMN